MNPDYLRDQARLLMLRRPLKPVQMRRLGKWLRALADEVDAGLWPRDGLVPSPYPRPGTAREYIARAEEAAREVA